VALSEAHCVRWGLGSLGINRLVRLELTVVVGLGLGGRAHPDPAVQAPVIPPVHDSKIANSRSR